MGINDITDQELVSLIEEERDTAKEIIFNKYNYLIDIYIKKYARLIYMFQIDEQELRSEALLGFSDGINSYSANKDASLKTFLSLCVNRRVMKYIEKQSRNKYKIFNEALSLDYKKDDESDALIDVISDQNKNNPLENLASLETINEIIMAAKENLSSFEYQVFSLMVQGDNYRVIANKLDKQPKQIDNTMQRIKVKMKKIIQELHDIS